MTQVGTASAEAGFRCVLIIFVYGCFVHATHGQGGPPATPVQAQAVQLAELVELRMVTGDLRALRRSRVASREAGIMLEMLVREGQRMARGELIAKLDDTRIRIERVRVEADLAVVHAEADERVAQLQQISRDLELIRESHERGGATLRELNDAESALAIAQARMEQSHRRKAVLQAQLSLLEARVADMHIVAPFDGVITHTLANSGEWLSEGAAVVELIESGRIEAWIRVPQTLIGSIRELSQPLQIQAEHNDKILQASNVRFVPDVGTRSRAFMTVATLENTDGMLAPGMSVRAWIPTGASVTRLLVPLDAILRNDAGPFVFVVRAQPSSGSSIAIPVAVRPMFPSGDWMAVESPQLDAGELVIVEGNERLQPMMPVQVIQATEAAHTSGQEISQ